MPLEGTDDFFMHWRNVPYVEVMGSPEGNFSFTRGMIPRSIYVGWEDVDAAILAFLGTVTMIPANNGKRVLSRTTPHPWPGRPWIAQTLVPPWLYCESVASIKPLGIRGATSYPASAALAPDGVSLGTGGKDDGTMVARYAQAELGLQYAMPTYKIKEDAQVLHDAVEPEPYWDPDLAGFPDEGLALARGYRGSRYVTRDARRSGRVLTMPRGLLKDETGRKLLEDVHVDESVGEWSYTWHQVPEEALPELTWVAGQGTVNHAAFDGHPAGTLLFTGNPEVRIDPCPHTGQYLATVRYVFSRKIIMDRTVTPVVPRGWNYRRTVTGGQIKPGKVSTDGNSDKANAPQTSIAPDFDFARFFRPDSL